MKLTKKLGFIVLSIFVLSACSQQEQVKSPINNNGDTIQTHEKKEVKKHESEVLPVTIFSNSDYKIEGQKVGFKRTITKVGMKDFNESSEIDFYDHYDKTVRNQSPDLQNDYKLLEVDIKHETEDVARSKPYEAYMLNDGSGLVIGDNELAIKNDFLMYQQDFLARDFKVGKTFEETGKMLIAIPREYSEDSNLQLRIEQQIDEEKKYIYIDLN